MTARKTRHHHRPGFTLLELLVVVAIVAGLVAVTTLVGTAVVNAGKNKATLGVLNTLDEALAAYIEAKGDIPPALVEVPVGKLPRAIADQMPVINGVPLPAVYPVVDGRAQEGNMNELEPVNSVGLFIESAMTVTQAKGIIDSINPRYIRPYTPNEERQPVLLTAFDAWGNPIRYVHPKFDGIIERTQRRVGQAGEPVHCEIPAKGFFTRASLPLQLVRLRMNVIRRNRLVEADYEFVGGTGGGGLDLQAASEYDLLPDSDGGLTVGNRPYFYSAGPDGDPSTIEDNIYISPVQHADPGLN